MNALPSVSVIVPALNAASSLAGLIEAIRTQSYPGEVELLVVDNGSTDGTLRLMEDAGLEPLREPRRGSYSARNLAIGRARGEILAFIDADCRPDREWIRRGIECLQNGADMAAGRLEWVLDNESVAARLSRASYGRQEHNVRVHGAGATGNLFIHRRVVEAIGPFDARILFGGDTLYTMRASEKGFKMSYCGEAVVRHPAHASIRSLLKRSWRAGFGLAQRSCLYGIGRPPHRGPGWYLPGARQLLEFARVEELTLLEYPTAFFLVWLTKLATVRGSLAGTRYCDSLSRGQDHSQL